MFAVFAVVVVVVVVGISFGRCCSGGDCQEVSLEHSFGDIFL